MTTQPIAREATVSREWRRDISSGQAVSRLSLQLADDARRRPRFRCRRASCLMIDAGQFSRSALTRSCFPTDRGARYASNSGVRPSPGLSNRGTYENDTASHRHGCGHGAVRIGRLCPDAHSIPESERPQCRIQPVAASCNPQQFIRDTANRGQQSSQCVYTRAA